MRSVKQLQYLIKLNKKKQARIQSEIRALKEAEKKLKKSLLKKPVQKLEKPLTLNQLKQRQQVLQKRKKSSEDLQKQINKLRTKKKKTPAENKKLESLRGRQKKLKEEIKERTNKLKNQRRYRSKYDKIKIYRERDKKSPSQAKGDKPVKIEREVTFKVGSRVNIIGFIGQSLYKDFFSKGMYEIDIKMRVRSPKTKMGSYMLRVEKNDQVRFAKTNPTILKKIRDDLNTPVRGMDKLFVSFDKKTSLLSFLQQWIDDRVAGTAKALTKQLKVQNYFINGIFTIIVKRKLKSKTKKSEVKEFEKQFFSSPINRDIWERFQKRKKK